MNTRIARWILIPFILTSCTSAAGLNNSETEQPVVTVTAEGSSFPLSAAEQNETTPEVTWSTNPDPLQIEVMREQTYTSSPITIEQNLDPGVNYNRYVVSYLSEGFKIYALMTVPFGNPPDTGWPVIIFNHGYIHPPFSKANHNGIS